ncbi:Fe(2+) transporter permease subunit FeoB [Tatumella terrea]|uniref:Ferrous iron transport protein B n=1 Tax=Tatumella terrea TaxID=419007 RepID=A0ABW1VY46_9GAMM
MSQQPLTIGLAGNPNTGKTTLFNQLTGASQRVGNWAGVTVERKEGFFSAGDALVRLVDLPGLYSLTMTSPETSLDEQIASEFILQQDAALLINVVDAAALQRNLWLTLQLRETGIPCIVVLNMMDVAQQRDVVPDIDLLSRALGCPVIPMVSTRGEGIQALKHAIAHLQTHGPGTACSLELPAELAAIRRQISENITGHFSPQLQTWLGLQVLEGDLYSRRFLSQEILSEILPEAEKSDTMALQIAGYRQQRCRELAQEVTHHRVAKPHRLTLWLDRLAMDRWLGLPVFLLLMYLMFFLAINVGGALQPLFESGSVTLFVHGIQWLGWMSRLPPGVTDFLASGIGGGITTVLPLIPQIGIMYLLMAFLEDAGYMARAAFVMDRLMQSLGLPGKSFVPLIIGFGCNVPSVMGTRTLDAPRERLMTLLMAPFMSCGARLAIFAVFSSVFFSSHGALAVFGLYLCGILVAILTGLLLKHTLLRGEASPFVMELPLYHLPHLKSVGLQSWQRLREFVWRAGKVIVMVSLLISGLNSFTLQGHPAGPGEEAALETVSKALTPLLIPFGVQPDNWQATVGLITGAMAKEVVIGTLNTLYTSQVIDEDRFDPETFRPLSELAAAWQETRESLATTFTLQVLENPIAASQGDAEISSGALKVMHQKFASSGAAFCYLLFVLLYVPCASVIGAIARESSRGWMLFSVFWGLSTAWSVATVAWQILSFSSSPFRAGAILFAVILYNLILVGILGRCKPRISVQSVPVSACGGCQGCGSRSGCH